MFEIIINNLEHVFDKLKKKSSYINASYRNMKHSREKKEMKID